MYPSLVREIVTCRAQTKQLHVYDDPVMLACGHVFCRSCCLNLALSAFDSVAICPTCQCRISFPTLQHFTDRLTTHDTLATMVKNYIEDQKWDQSTSNEFDENENEQLKMTIIQTMDRCEELLSTEKIETMEKLRNQMKEWKGVLRQRVDEIEETLNLYERQLHTSLREQEETNERNL